MSKAALVLDMPKSCRECPAGNSMISDKEGEFCACEFIFILQDKVRCIDNYISSRPDQCPLRELPQKMIPDPAEKGNGFVDGWNACIDAITEKVIKAKWF